MPRPETAHRQGRTRGRLHHQSMDGDAAIIKGKRPSDLGGITTLKPYGDVGNIERRVTPFS